MSQSGCVRDLEEHAVGDISLHLAPIGRRVFRCGAADGTYATFLLAWLLVAASYQVKCEVWFGLSFSCSESDR